MGLEPPILIVEDDREMSETLRAYLAREGFRTIAAYSGRDALDLAARQPPLLAVLDVSLPDLDGWEICRRLRETSSIPILFLSASSAARDRVRGLTLGADDYLVKPCDLDELTARIKAILRRTMLRPAPRQFSHCGLTIDLGRREVRRNGRPVSLTPSEFTILQMLIAAPGRVYRRKELLAALYPSGGVVIERVVDVHVGKLRQKIEDKPSAPRFVITAKGLGYRFADAEVRS